MLRVRMHTLLCKDALPVDRQPIEQDPGHSAAPVRDGRPFSRSPNSVINTEDRGFPTTHDHFPTTSGPRWLMSRSGPTPRVRKTAFEVTWFSITPGCTGTRHLRYPTYKNQGSLVTVCAVVRLLPQTTHCFRSVAEAAVCCLTQLDHIGHGSGTRLTPPSGPSPPRSGSPPRASGRSRPAPSSARRSASRPPPGRGARALAPGLGRQEVDEPLEPRRGGVSRLRVRPGELAADRRERASRGRVVPVAGSER